MTCDKPSAGYKRFAWRGHPGRSRSRSPRLLRTQAQENRSSAACHPLRSSRLRKNSKLSTVASVYDVCDRRGFRNFNAVGDLRPEAAENIPRTPSGVHPSCKHANPVCRKKRSTRGLCPCSPPGCHAGGVFGNLPRVRVFCVLGQTFPMKTHPEEVRGVSRIFVSCALFIDSCTQVIFGRMQL